MTYLHLLFKLLLNLPVNSTAPLGFLFSPSRLLTVLILAKLFTLPSNVVRRNSSAHAQFIGASILGAASRKDRLFVTFTDT